MESNTVLSEEDMNQMLIKNFTNEFRTGYVTIKDICMPIYYLKFSDAIENFDVREDDIWVCSFPKTGTTWTQEMIWCIDNNLDFEGAKMLLSERFPFLEMSPLFDYSTIILRKPELILPKLVLNSVEYINELPSPRYIKTHLPYDLLPKQIRNGQKKPKIIYVARNAKDTCISYFHHCKLLEGYRGNFDDFCNLFLTNKLTFTPFWKHILDFWIRKNDNNVLFLKYEDMKMDLPSVIKKTAAFLQKDLDENQAKILTNHLSFNNMKINPAVNYTNVININKKFKLIESEGQFIRSGTVNQWKKSMSPKMIKRFDNWTQENLKNTDFSFNT